MVLVKNFKFFHVFILGKIGQENVCDDILERIDYKNKGLNKLQKPWTKILLVVNVGSLEKRSNQPKYKETKTRSPKTTAKLI